MFKERRFKDRKNIILALAIITTFVVFSIVYLWPSARPASQRTSFKNEPKGSEISSFLSSIRSDERGFFEKLRESFSQSELRIEKELTSFRGEEKRPNIPLKSTPLPFLLSTSTPLVSDTRPLLGLGASTSSSISTIFPRGTRFESQLVGLKLLAPKSFAGVLELLELLRGFGELISSPAGQLTEKFRKQDIAILEKTKEVYGNPSHFVLGEQCGLSAGTFSFPPGVNDFYTACGGTPPIGGTEGAPFVSGNTCNTDPPCYFTGFCFQETYCYCYLKGDCSCYSYCWEPSCYGWCRGGGYLWNSAGDEAGKCGCTDSASNPGSWGY
jgi:hypothetical protein